MHLSPLRTLFLALSLAFCASSYAQKDEALLKAVDGRKAGFVADLEKLVKGRNAVMELANQLHQQLPALIAQTQGRLQLHFQSVC